MTWVLTSPLLGQYETHNMVHGKYKCENLLLVMKGAEANIFTFPIFLSNDLTTVRWSSRHTYIGLKYLTINRLRLLLDYFVTFNDSLELTDSNGYSIHNLTLTFKNTWQAQLSVYTYINTKNYGYFQDFHSQICMRVWLYMVKTTNIK